jgi:6-phosphogluconolactonase
VIDIHPDAEALARAVATRVAEEAMQAVHETGRFTIALAGGSTPKRAYELLAESPLRDKLPWQSVHVYWSDERCVPATDERSNERMARVALLDHVRIADAHVHPMRCADDPHAAADAYERELQSAIGAARSPLDLVVLGMGDDGHTAGLFPGSPALEEMKRWTAVVQKAGEPHQRITMTLPILNLARHVLFVVSGESKAAMLRTIVEEGGGDERLPAARIAPLEGEPLWMIDREAASRLSICL